MNGGLCNAEQAWSNRSVLIAEDVHIVQLTVDVLHVAKVLSSFSLDDYLHRHLQPLLAVHAGWEHVRSEVTEAMEDLEDAIEPRRTTRIARTPIRDRSLELPPHPTWEHWRQNFPCYRLQKIIVEN